MAELKGGGTGIDASRTQGVDPFAPENVGAVQLVVAMRIYDALMALLQATDAAAHDQLNEIHESGGVAWSLPWIDLTSPDEESNAADAFVPPTA